MTKVTLSSQVTLGNFGRVWTSDVIGDHHVSFTMHLALRFTLSCGVMSYHRCGVMSSRSYTFITAIPLNHLYWRNNWFPLEFNRYRNFTYSQILDDKVGNLTYAPSILVVP